MAYGLPILSAGSVLASTVGLPLTVSIGVVGLLTILGNKVHKGRARDTVSALQEGFVCDLCDSREWGYPVNAFML